MTGTGQASWERHAKNYDRSMVLLGGPMRRMLELTRDAVAGVDTVLEVGAGTGLYRLLRRHGVQLEGSLDQGREGMSGPQGCG
jgi:hypothetical protein